MQLWRCAWKPVFHTNITVKCYDSDSCGQPRSSFFMFNDRFLSPPVPVIETENYCGHVIFGIILDKEKFHHCSFWKHTSNDFAAGRSWFQTISHDAYCHSLKNVLACRVCRTCGLYHASVWFVPAHRNAISNWVCMLSSLCTCQTKGVRRLDGGGVRGNVT